MKTQLRCLGETKAGNQCRQMVYILEGTPYCSQHEQQRPAPERILSLRELLHQPPSIALWEELQDKLCKWPDSERIMALDYVAQHLDEWPNRYRTSHGFRTNHPTWSLVRHVHFNMGSLPQDELLQDNPQIVELGAFCKDRKSFQDLANSYISTKLTTLQIDGIASDLVTQGISKFTQLKSLQISACELPLVALGGLLALEELSHTGGPLCFSDLISLPKLHTVQISGNISNHLGLIELPFLRKLTMASSSFAGPLSLYKSRLKGFENLEELDLSQHEHVRNIATVLLLPSLKTLHLPRSPRSEDIMALVDHSPLARLYFVDQNNHKRYIKLPDDLEKRRGIIEGFVDSL